MATTKLDINPENKVFIFGTGEGGKRCLNYLLESNVTVMGFIDNDKNKQRVELDGAPVFSPERLKQKDFDKIIVASMYWVEIKNQLEGMGFIEGKDFRLEPTINLLTGDRDIEWSWVASQIPSGPGKAFDFGPENSYLSLLAARRGFQVTAVDIQEVKWSYVHPNIEFIQGDILKLLLPTHHFDLIINCSTVEHVGLTDRYGVTEYQPDGDIDAMGRLRNMLKPDGVMIMTIPVGRDAVFAPLHRVYGRKRLPRLLDGFAVEKQEYWIKNNKNCWITVDEKIALDQQPQELFYGLGCYLLRAERIL